jgi:hypothetical protein
MFNIFNRPAKSNGGIENPTEEFAQLRRETKTLRPLLAGQSATVVSINHIRALENWQKLRSKILPIVRGAFKECTVLKEHCYLEKLDPHHLYGNLHHKMLRNWLHSDTDQSYFDWVGAMACKGVYQVPPDQLHSQFEIRIVDGRIMFPSQFKRDWLNYIRTHAYTDLIFVMDRHHRLFAGFKKTGRFHHSSFLQGAPVKMAGTISVNHRGELLAVSNASGHYQPTAEKIKFFLDTLNAPEAFLAKLQVECYDWTSMEVIFDGSAIEYLQSVGRLPCSPPV